MELWYLHETLYQHQLNECMGSNYIQIKIRPRYYLDIDFSCARMLCETISIIIMTFWLNPIHVSNAQV